MDIHAKSVDMDMDMDGKFHIHGNPDLNAYIRCDSSSHFSFRARTQRQTNTRSHRRNCSTFKPQLAVSSVADLPKTIYTTHICANISPWLFSRPSPNLGWIYSQIVNPWLTPVLLIFHIPPSCGIVGLSRPIPNPVENVAHDFWFPCKIWRGSLKNQNVR